MITCLDIVTLKFVILHFQESDHCSAHAKEQLQKQPFKGALSSFPEQQLWIASSATAFPEVIQKKN